MAKSEWKARTKHDLMIEVWEHLDCESVGAREIEAVMKAVRERFGEGGVESPARTARVLADEGAELRHAEVLEADARWRTGDPYEAMFRNVLKFSTFDEAAASLKRLDNLRREFKRRNDKDGLRRVTETVLKGKQRAQMISRNASVNEGKRAEKAEIADWFAVWLRQPEIFEDWLHLRRRSPEFRKRFNGSDE
jgi:Ni/Co efflux regulator RcnB